MTNAREAPGAGQVIARMPFPLGRHVRPPRGASNRPTAPEFCNEVCDPRLHLVVDSWDLIDDLAEQGVVHGAKVTLGRMRRSPVAMKQPSAEQFVRAWPRRESRFVECPVAGDPVAPGADAPADLHPRRGRRSVLGDRVEHEPWDQQHGRVGQRRRRPKLNRVDWRRPRGRRLVRGEGSSSRRRV
jgi:hypothetical protein